jgi:hypothetical protein
VRRGERDARCGAASRRHERQPLRGACSRLSSRARCTSRRCGRGTARTLTAASAQTAMSTASATTSRRSATYAAYMHTVLCRGNESFAHSPRSVAVYTNLTRSIVLAQLMCAHLLIKLHVNPLAQEIGPP